MLKELLDHLNAVKTLLDGSELETTMQEVAIDTQKQLGEINFTYKTDLEMKDAVEKILERDVPETVRIRQPFYMDFGKNIEFGKDVFINGACHFQDHGDIKIGNNAFIGHQMVLATLDHDLAPNKRGDMPPAPIVIEDDVWIGSGSLVFKGITIGEGSVVAGGSVVTKDVPANVIVGGNLVRVLKKLNEE